MVNHTNNYHTNDSHTRLWNWHDGFYALPPTFCSPQINFARYVSFSKTINENFGVETHTRLWIGARCATIAKCTPKQLYIYLLKKDVKMEMKHCSSAYEKGNLWEGNLVHSMGILNPGAGVISQKSLRLYVKCGVYMWREEPWLSSHPQGYVWPYPSPKVKTTVLR